MLSDENKLHVTISYKSIQTEFSGSPEVVMISVNEFLSKQIPVLDLAHKITINYSVAELIDNFGQYVKITSEGPRVWLSNQKLSDKDTICLQLIAAKISYMTGKANSPFVTLQELYNSTNLKPKSISSRLSEVTKAGYVEREQLEQGARYMITTQGIYWLNSVLEKKIGSKN